jgi:hypothetical protein
MRRPTYSIAHVSALESRTLLSGNVLFQFSGGVLRLTGDNSNNQIAITQNVEGLQITALNGTKLGGVTNGSQIISNPTSTFIDLKGGDDTLSLEKYLGGTVDVLLGSGNDQVAMTSVVTEGAITVDLGSGNDKLRTGGTAEAPNQAPSMTFKGNSGNDQLLIDQLLTSGKLSIDCGSGNDVLGLSHVRSTDTARIDLGQGNDLMKVSFSIFNSAATFLGNTGDDIIGINGNRFAALISIDLGNGKDALLSESNQMEANLSRLGGTGTDLSYKNADTVSGTETISGFETQTTTVTPQVTPLITKLNAAFA